MVGLAKLQSELDGVYDLENAQDCRKVIQILLRNLERANTRANELMVRLKGLALKVMSGSADMKDAARTALTESPSGRVDIMGFIMRMVKEMDGVRSMSDDALVSEVLDKVWANYDISGRESALLGELMERFRKTVPTDVQSFKHRQEGWFGDVLTGKGCRR